MIDITKLINYIKMNNYPLYLEIIKNEYIQITKHIINKL